MTVTPTPQPVPRKKRDERKAIVYVLKEHLNGRDFNEHPNKNASAWDLDEIYAQDRLVNYPVVRDRYEWRLLAEQTRKASNYAWAQIALDALYAGRPIPGLPRDRYEQVLTQLVIAGPDGRTRPEICRRYGIDGGRVSAALTYLHEAGVIFSLPGVLR
jgi:hypothetical protein